MTETILKVKDLTRRFGGLIAVDNVSFDVKKNEILSIIGPNGAGKSTLFKLIASFLKPNKGSVLLNDKVISGLRPHVVARMGVVRTFQETTIFRNLSVIDNVIIAHHLSSKASLFGFFINSPQAIKDETSFRNSANDILEFLGLNSMKDEIALNLPHGHLRALGIAIGLATNPTILLLDEPFAGMNQEETLKAVEIVKEVRKRNVTVLVVEHDMQAVMKISDRIVVLNFGKKIAEGTTTEIQKNKKVIEAYLGSEDDSIGV